MSAPPQRGAQETTPPPGPLATQPPLPDLPDDMPWPEATLQWWQTWGRSEQAKRFTDTDWAQLVNAALVHADIWGNWNLDRVPQLQSILVPFGGTPAARSHLAGEPAVEQSGIPPRWLVAVPGTGTHAPTPTARTRQPRARGRR